MSQANCPAALAGAASTLPLQLDTLMQKQYSSEQQACPLAQHQPQAADAHAAVPHQHHGGAETVPANVRAEALTKASKIIQAAGQQPNAQLVAVVAARLVASCHLPLVDKQQEQQLQQEQQQRQQHNSRSSHHSSSSFTGEGSALYCAPAPLKRALGGAGQRPNSSSGQAPGTVRFCRRNYNSFRVNTGASGALRSMQSAGSKQLGDATAAAMGVTSQQQQPPPQSHVHARGKGRTTCQVDGCLADLPAGKETYTGRYRVCSRHRMDGAVLLHADRPEELYRFCNQCFKFELLACFDDTKRGCRASLARRRERQRLKRLQQQPRGHKAATSAPSGAGTVAWGFPAPSLWADAAPASAVAVTCNSSMELSATKLLGGLHCELIDCDGTAAGGLQALPSELVTPSTSAAATAGAEAGAAQNSLPMANAGSWQLPAAMPVPAGLPARIAGSTCSVAGDLSLSSLPGILTLQLPLQQLFAQQQPPKTRQQATEQSAVGWSATAGPGATPPTPLSLSKQPSAEVMSAEQVQLQQLLMRGLAPQQQGGTQTLTGVTGAPAAAAAAARMLPPPAVAAAGRAAIVASVPALVSRRQPLEAASAAHAGAVAAAPGVAEESVGHFSSSSSGDEEEEEATSQDEAEDAEVTATSACASSSSAKHERSHKVASRAAVRREQQRRQQRRSLRPKKVPRWQHSMKIALKRSQRIKKQQHTAPAAAAAGRGNCRPTAAAAAAVARRQRSKRHQQHKRPQQEVSQHAATLMATHAALAAAADAAAAGTSAVAVAAERQVPAAAADAAIPDLARLISCTTWPNLLDGQLEEIATHSCAPELLVNTQSLDLARLASVELLKAVSSSLGKQAEAGAEAGTAGEAAAVLMEVDAAPAGADAGADAAPPAVAAAPAPTTNKVYSAMLEELADWYTSTKPVEDVAAALPRQASPAVAGGASSQGLAVQCGGAWLASDGVAAAAEAPGSAVLAASGSLALGQELEAVLKSYNNAGGAYALPLTANLSSAAAVGRSAAAEAPAGATWGGSSCGSWKLRQEPAVAWADQVLQRSPSSSPDSCVGAGSAKGAGDGIRHTAVCAELAAAAAAAVQPAAGAQAAAGQAPAPCPPTGAFAVDDDSDDTAAAAAAAHAAELERQLADVQLQMREMQKMLGILRAQHGSCAGDATATTQMQPATGAALMGSMPEISGPQGADWNTLA